MPYGVASLQNKYVVSEAKLGQYLREFDQEIGLFGVV